MEIILLEKIQNVGDPGDIVKVRNGYARNYLIPQKKAVLATPEAKAEVVERRRQLAEHEQSRLADAQARAEKMPREVSITRLCADGGQLYGSVSPIDIAEAFAEAGAEIEKSEITQTDGPIKKIGEHIADVILHPEVRFTVKITVAGKMDDGSVVDFAPELVVQQDGDISAAPRQTDEGADQPAAVDAASDSANG